MQPVFQDPTASLNPRLSVRRMVEEPLKLHTQMSAAERRERTDAVLEEVGLGADFAERYAHELSLLEAEELRPGILDYLEAAERHGLKRAIVSSASRPWIDMHLERLERAVGWDAIVTADHDPQRAKPRPTLYLEALEALGLEPEEAIAFEDSPNGAKAAKAAGLYVVGIPNDVTRDLGLADAADTVVDSLAELPPDELLARFA